MFEELMKILRFCLLNNLSCHPTLVNLYLSGFFKNVDGYLNLLFFYSHKNDSVVKLPVNHVYFYGLFRD